jgi:predicted TIM-barrel fold metal-dependent hydrolase
MSRVIDTCVHHRWASASELAPYLEPHWRAYTVGPVIHGELREKEQIGPNVRFRNPAGDDKAGTESPTGPAGSNLELMQRQVLGRNGLERAILLHGREMFIPALPNPFQAIAMTSAMNDWTIERWLSEDERLFGAIVVPTQTPTEAAAEIRRVGSHPKVVGVLLAAIGLSKLFGHPVYNPIYEAATDLDLPIIIHRGGDAIPETSTGIAGGSPGTFAAYSTLAPIGLMSQVLSLIGNGVLTKYPGLRICLVGSGVAWIPGLLRRMELSWRANRPEVPWIHESPAEYFYRHFRVSTYGLERGHAQPLIAKLLIQNPRLADAICYGSGYPAWDMGEPEEIEEAFPVEWRARVFSENANVWFRWPTP